jgi:hypothetical protein
VAPAQECARYSYWIEAALTHSSGLGTIEDAARAIEHGSYQAARIIWRAMTAA